MSMIFSGYERNPCRYCLGIGYTERALYVSDNPYRIITPHGLRKRLREEKNKWFSQWFNKLGWRQCREVFGITYGRVPERLGSAQKEAVALASLAIAEKYGVTPPVEKLLIRRMNSATPRKVGK